METERIINDYIIGYNIIDNLKNCINLSRKCLIVTDNNLSKLHLDRIVNCFYNPLILVIESGENSKNIYNYQKILEMLLNNNLSKTDLLVGFGGGVIGDLCGFVASTYKRGICYLHIPTTIISIVDSSIGYKNGINLGGADGFVKNVIGTYYKPSLVYASFDLLETLPIRDLISGLIESLKIFFIADIKLVDYFFTLDFYNLSRDDLYNIIKKSIIFKNKIIQSDLYEKGIRKQLNFGHTFGHAIEMCCNLLHGESVGLGMLPFIKNDYYQKKLKQFIDKYIRKTTIDKKALYNLVLNDKKWANGYLSCLIYTDEIKIKQFNEKEIKDMIYEINIWD